MASADPQVRSSSKDALPGSLRHTVLLTAKRFKSSWVELGKLLVQVRDQALFEEWGYPSFESYCLAELKIRKQTAYKLTRSFGFLDRHEQEAVRQPDITEVAPPFEVVEVLAQAEERGQLSAQEYKSIRDSIWNQERPPSEMRRELTERFPGPAPEAPTGDQLVKRHVALAKKLALELQGNKKVPRAIVERALALVEDLEGLEASASAN